MLYSWMNTFVNENLSSSRQQKYMVQVTVEARCSFRLMLEAPGWQEWNCLAAELCGGSTQLNSALFIAVRTQQKYTNNKSKHTIVNSCVKS